MEGEKKVTRALLSSMKTGETANFTFSDYHDVESGKNTAYNYSKVLGCKFMCKVDRNEDFNFTLLITRQ
jgi:hypothetical protein